MLADLGEEAQPQHRHLALGDGFGLELRQLHIDKAQTLDAPLGVQGVHDGIVVDELVVVALETHVVDKAQTDDVGV